MIKHLYKNEIGETNELEALCKNISTFLEKEKDLEKEDVNLKIKIDILKSYIRAKDLYLNYNSDEELIFDDIYDEHNNKTFFTNKHPSLLNYIICNNKIYKNLLPIIIALFYIKNILYLPYSQPIIIIIINQMIRIVNLCG